MAQPQLTTIPGSAADATCGDALLDRVDRLRVNASRSLDAKQQIALGQFFTPAPLAHFMAAMLDLSASHVRLLDPGCGVGTLFAACVAQLCARQRPPVALSITAYERDPQLAVHARQTLAWCREVCQRVGTAFNGQVIGDDFIRCAVRLVNGDLFSPTSFEPFDAVILNPPYRKIAARSETRQLLRQLGIETSNLYTGFVAVAIQLLVPGGEIAAITPRSFCNGVYFRPFRESLLRSMTLRRLHVFDSRTQAFSDDGVLQENIILSATKGHDAPSPVLITYSGGPHDDLIAANRVAYDQVVHPGDPHSYIHLVADGMQQQFTDLVRRLPCRLRDLDWEVSTGRVVDFRAREFLRPQPQTGTAPLIYPMHFQQGSVVWPKPNARKPNALVQTARTAELLIPNACYVLVKRFSSKEEKRRVVAAVYDVGQVPGAEVVGFENHLNYFHRHGSGLDLTLARGLAAYLNSTVVDQYFRQFSGHTQVNATDLRNLPFPSMRQLQALGRHVGAALPGQDEIDHLVQQEVFGMADSQGDDPVRAKRRIEEALAVLGALGLPRAQQNQRSALTLLAVLDLRPEMPWSEANTPLRGITQMMEFFKQHYGVEYAPNTRETVRRHTIHQFLEAGLVIENPDKPDRPINSPDYVYQVDSGALELLRTYGTSEWEQHLQTFLASYETLRARYAQLREMARIPVRVAEGQVIDLSPGGQNVLVEQIVHEFAPRFIPGGHVLYVGDTDKKFAYFDQDRLATLGVSIEAHGKMPDVIMHDTSRNWLVLIEAVTSHGPVNPLRKDELSRLFAGATAGLVFVTAFLNRKAMMQYLGDISWETEVWVADAPDHLIHFNGDRFLGPHSNRTTNGFTYPPHQKPTKS